MKLKYKKIVLLITMSTMCIGFVTLTAGSPDKNKSSQVEEELKNSSIPLMEKDGNLEVNATAKSTEETKKSNDTEEKIEPKGLQRDAYPKINDLVKKYVNAYAACDIETLYKIVSKTNNLELNRLQEKANYIESYDNIECYTLPGPEENSYVVYVYEEVKFKDVDTRAPGMIRLYIRTSKEGKLYIHLGTIDETTLTFINETANNEDIKRILDTVNKKCEEAKTKDPQLKEKIEEAEGGSKTNKKDK